ncbi:thioredoxin family protein [Lutibacter holmesii]|uniref:Thioredoxin family protein n=1 Tax=Lutibacter holmesii TaxID=1137985 RepID=A0ABW3WSD7_9FLAO
MKKIVLSCLFIVSSIVFVNAQDSVKLKHSVNWEKSFSKAEKLAKKKNKNLLIFFTGSDWCGPCKMLVEDFFETEQFKNIAEQDFILYEADNPRNKDLVSETQRADNLKLGSKYKVSSYPTIVVVNSKGKEIGRKKSYNFMRDPSYHFSFLEEIVKK